VSGRNEEVGATVSVRGFRSTAKGSTSSARRYFCKRLTDTLASTREEMTCGSMFSGKRSTLKSDRAVNAVAASN
jgi:hypothetical protein